MGQIFLAAIQSGAGEKAITALCQLREVQERKQEERELNAAMTQFQAECPTIKKNKMADFEGRTGRVSYEFATLDQVVSTLTPTAAKCGLSYSFDSEMSDGKQIVKCTIRHVGGGSRTSTYAAPIGGTTTMSDMQKGASALTYARRYALLLAFGLGTADMDDDANCTDDKGPREPPITPNELRALLKRIVAHIQDSGARRSYVNKLGVTGDPNLPESWNRQAYATAKEFCDTSEGASQ
jgi:hypothetical protein